MTNDPTDVEDNSAPFGEDDIVELVNEEGEAETFVIMAIIDNGNNEFAVLSPVEQVLDQESAEIEMIIFRYSELEEDDKVVQAFTPVEDEEEYERVCAFCMTLPQFQPES
jgi:uncharacterized protein YrzB (UPF0473 family)